jgi:hypothetical protein
LVGASVVVEFDGDTVGATTAGPIGVVWCCRSTGEPSEEGGEEGRRKDGASDMVELVDTVLELVDVSFDVTLVTIALELIDIPLNVAMVIFVLELFNVMFDGTLVIIVLELVDVSFGDVTVVTFALELVDVPFDVTFVSAMTAVVVFDKVCVVVLARGNVPEVLTAEPV